MSKQWLAPAWIACLVAGLTQAQTAAPSMVSQPPSRPEICKNATLIQAISVVHQACTGDFCQFPVLKQLDNLDKALLLAAMRHPDSKSVHVFFPIGKSDLKDILDWQTIKKSQVGTLAYLDDPSRAAVYILGQASPIGDAEMNRLLSQERMLSVLEYLKFDLKVNCAFVRGGYLGSEILQLTPQDADFMQISRRDYREDPKILNQSVHVFIFPCADLLPSVTGEH